MPDVTQSQIQARARYFDRNGKPLSGGKVYAYELGTMIPKPTFNDAQGQVPNSNPIILDAAGQANIFGNGLYTLVTFDKNNVQIDSIDGALAFDISNVAQLRALFCPAQQITSCMCI